MKPKLASITAAVAAATISSSALALDLASITKISTVAAVEGTLRTMAGQCADAQFAAQFTKVSQAMIVSGRLSNKDQDPAQVEADIAQAVGMVNLNGLYTSERCAKMMPDLQALYESRVQSLNKGAGK